MHRPYREVEKSFAYRVLEFLDAIQLIADALEKVRAGESRYLMVLSGQLRSLVAERSRGEVPLLLDVAARFGKKLDVYCSPGVDNPGLPEAIRTHAETFFFSSPPLTLEKRFVSQRLVGLADLLDENVFLYRGNKYSRRTLIEWYANKAGGSHYSSSMPEDFASLKGFTNVLVQVGQVTLDLARQILRAIIEFEFEVVIVIPPQKIEPGNREFYLVDSQYEGSSMRRSLTVDGNLVPSFTVSGLQGKRVRVECDRLIDWSAPRLLQTSIRVEDDFSTTLELSVDGEGVGRTNVETPAPMFVLADPRYYLSYHNRAVDGGPQKFSFGVSHPGYIAGEPNRKERAQLLLTMLQRRQAPDLQVYGLSAEAFLQVEKGTGNLNATGDARFELASEFLQRQARQ